MNKKNIKNMSMVSMMVVLMFVVSAFSTGGDIAPMAHTSDVTLSPDVSNCNVPTQFTVNVENTGIGGFGIYDVKIAKTQVNIDTLTCGLPPTDWSIIVDDA